MGRRELGLGVLVAIAMVAAVYLTRGRDALAPGTVGSAGADTALAASGSDVPDASANDVRLLVGGVAVLVEAPTRPITAFGENRLLFRFEGVKGQAGHLLEVGEATLSFTMKMDMGKHRYALVPATREGWLQADFVLPACPSGGRRWYGILTFASDGQKLETRFQFDLAPRSD